MFAYRVDGDLVLRLPEEDDAAELLALFERDRAYLTYWNDWPKRMQTVEDCKGFILGHRRAFGEEGVQRQGGVARGEFMDMWVYSLLAEEWRGMEKDR